MNALNFAILGLIAMQLWCDMEKDFVDGAVRAVIIIGGLAFIGWRLGGWM